MKTNNMMAMRKVLTDLVDYLNKEVQRTSKCERCEYNGKSFRGEPCYWHVDCGIEDYDKKASNNAMYLMKRFKLKKALSKPPRNCDIGTAEEQINRFEAFCKRKWDCKKDCPIGRMIDCDNVVAGICQLTWAQMPYEEEANNEQK